MDERLRLYLHLGTEAQSATIVQDVMIVTETLLGNGVSSPEDFAVSPSLTRCGARRAGGRGADLRVRKGRPLC